MSTFRKILLVLLFVGAAGNIGGAGTMASFNASTTNATSTFSSGSIVLSNTNEFTGNTCFSNGTNPTNGGTGTDTDDNHNASCEALFSVATRAPGQTATAELTIVNEGSLPGELTLLPAPHVPPGDVTPVVPCSIRDAIDTAYHGGGDICDNLRLTVQRWTDENRNVVYSTAPGGCVYGIDTGADNDCDLDDTRDLKHFTEDPGVVAGISLGNLTENAGANDTAYLTITVEFPDGSIIGDDNLFQGLVASFAMQWHLEQL